MKIHYNNSPAVLYNMLCNTNKPTYTLELFNIKPSGGANGSGGVSSNRNVKVLFLRKREFRYGQKYCYFQWLHHHVIL